MASKSKHEYEPKARFKISKTGGPMKGKKDYNRNRKHKRKWEENDND